MSAETPLSSERIEEIRQLRARLSTTMDALRADRSPPPFAHEPPRPSRVAYVEAHEAFRAAAPQIADDCIALAEENARLLETRHAQMLALEDSQARCASLEAENVALLAEIERLRAALDEHQDALHAAGVDHFKLLDDVERLRGERDAWEAFAEHAAHCVECGEMSYGTCPDGKPLYDAARSPRSKGE